MTNWIFGAFLAVAVVAVPVQAKEGYIYACDLSQTRGGGGFIGSKIAIIVHPTGKLSVIDGLIMHYHGEALPVKVLRSTKKKLLLEWVVDNVRDGSNTRAPKFVFSARLERKSGKIRINGRPQGFPNHFQENGSCEVLKKGKKP